MYIRVAYLLLSGHDVLQEVDIGAVFPGQEEPKVLSEKLVELVLALEPLLELADIVLHHLGW